MPGWVASLVTVPPPVPGLVTVRVRPRVKLAVTDLSSFIVTMQVPVPPQPEPLQPVNTDPSSAFAVRVTVPWSNVAVHSVVQLLIPEGELCTEPLPLPVTVTVKSHCLMNVAVTDLAASIVTTQVPVPGHAGSDQPPNLEPDAAVAVRVTTVPWS